MQSSSHRPRTNHSSQLRLQTGGNRRAWACARHRAAGDARGYMRPRPQHKRHLAYSLRCVGSRGMQRHTRHHAKAGVKKPARILESLRANNRFRLHHEANGRRRRCRRKEACARCTGPMCKSDCANSQTRPRRPCQLYASSNWEAPLCLCLRVAETRLRLGTPSAVASIGCQRHVLARPAQRPSTSQRACSLLCGRSVRGTLTSYR
jgi:hypothetical protein